MGFLLYSLNMVNYTDRVSDIGSSLHSKEKSHLFKKNCCLICCWIWLANIVHGIAASMFIGEMAHNFLFLSFLYLNLDML